MGGVLKFNVLTISWMVLTVLSYVHDAIPLWRHWMDHSSCHANIQASTAHVSCFYLYWLPWQWYMFSCSANQLPEAIAIRRWTFESCTYDVQTVYTDTCSNASKHSQTCLLCLITLSSLFARYHQHEPPPCMQECLLHRCIFCTTKSSD